MSERDGERERCVVVFLESVRDLGGSKVCLCEVQRYCV